LYGTSNTWLPVYKKEEEKRRRTRELERKRTATETKSKTSDNVFTNWVFSFNLIRGRMEGRKEQEKIEDRRILR
jgi:hypothetical protein